MLIQSLCFPLYLRTGHRPGVVGVGPSASPTPDGASNACAEEGERTDLSKVEQF